MSEYSDIKSTAVKRGRKPLPPEEKARRVEIQKQRQEARRRAMIVLQHRHTEEFNLLVQNELAELSSSSPTS